MISSLRTLPFVDYDCSGVRPDRDAKTPEDRKAIARVKQWSPGDLVPVPSFSAVTRAALHYPSGVPMQFEAFSFGSIRIDGTTYEHDVVIDRGKIRKRKKKPSKKFRDDFGHTPLSIHEKIPWKCRRLIVGTGTGELPVMDEVKKEARRRRIKLVVLPTSEAIEELEAKPEETNAILHVTC